MNRRRTLFARTMSLARYVSSSTFLAAFCSLTTCLLLGLFFRAMAYQDNFKVMWGHWDAYGIINTEIMKLEIGYQPHRPSAVNEKYPNPVSVMIRPGFVCVTNDRVDEGVRESFLNSLTTIFENLNIASVNLSSALPSNNPWHSELAYVIEIPPILLFGLLLIQPVLWLCWLYSRRKFEAGLCQRCGYDLRASGTQCPECGTPVSGAVVSQVAPNLKLDNPRYDRFRLAVLLAVTILVTKLIISFIWIYILPAFHVEYRWPTVLSFLTSAPILFSRFVDRPSLDLASVAVYVTAMAINSFFWGYIAACAVKLWRLCRLWWLARLSGYFR